jgi:hypothetical protein
VQCKQRLERTVQDSLAETGNAATELSALRELLVAHIGKTRVTLPQHLVYTGLSFQPYNVCPQFGRTATAALA